MKVIGSSPVITTCDNCGREKLKQTIMFMDGLKVSYFGTECAVRALGLPDSYQHKISRYAYKVQAVREALLAEQTPWYAQFARASVNMLASVKTFATENNVTIYTQFAPSAVNGWKGKKVSVTLNNRGNIG